MTREIVTLALTVITLCIDSRRRVDAQDMPLTQVLIDGEDWMLLADGFKFTEGPAADADGNVYFSDIPNSRIHRIDVEGNVTVFAEDTAKTNGLMFGAGGVLFGCRNGDKKIVAYRPDGSFETIANDVECNDLVVASDGSIWFTDPANSRVWYISPDRQKRVVAGGFRPNGVILSARQGSLVVTDSEQPHLWTFCVELDGSLSHGDRYYMPLQLLPGRDKAGSDGMTVDDRGRLYVATHAGIQMFDPTGRLGGTIAKPQNRFLSNICFGGEGFGYLYATCSDKVYRRKVKPTGTPYFVNSNSK